MIRKVSFVALALLGCTSAVAATDGRIRTMAYDANQIVRILGKAGIQSTIEFAPDERIENVAVGDSSAWQITPNRRASLLFVKPLTPHTRTNMTVVTDQRTYMFDLVAGEKSTTPVYALKFSYPKEKLAQAAAESAQQMAAASPPAQPAAMMRADQLHFDWGSKGNGKLLPSRVFDDGASLYLAWDRDTPLPAILTQAEDKKEGPVNYRMSGEYIIVSPIPPNLVLRSGKRVAVLWPKHPIAPIARQPSTAIAGRIATASAAPVRTASGPMAQNTPAETSTGGTRSSVKVANVTALYSDKLTGGGNEH